jgi:hypothetical protein
VDIAARQRIKFDDEQFAALSNELQASGDKTKLMQFVWSLNSLHVLCYICQIKVAS